MQWSSGEALGGSKVRLPNPHTQKEWGAVRGRAGERREQEEGGKAEI